MVAVLDVPGRDVGNDIVPHFGSLLRAFDRLLDAELWRRSDRNRRVVGEMRDFVVEALERH